MSDHLWVRVVDVAAALAARTYGADDALVLELIDDVPPGEQRLLARSTVAPTAPTCTRTDRAADLTLSAADLGALYLGGVPASTLAAAGRVTELMTGAVARADRFFLAHPHPGAPRTSDAARASVYASVEPTALSWMIASIGPGSTSLSSAR